MYLLKKAVQFISPLLILGAFIFWSMNNEATYHIAGIFLFIHIFSIIIISRKKERGSFINFFLTPFFLLFASFIFFLIIDNAVIIYIFSFLIAILYYLVLFNIIAYIFQSAGYQPNALENIYSYVNLVSLFLLYAGGYGFMVLLGWPVWVFIISCFFVTGLLFMRTLWSYKIEWNKSKLYILIVAFVLAELFYVVSLFPTSYIFNGLILIIVYYLLINFIKDHLKDRINPKDTRFYLILSSVVLILSLLTSRWS